MSNVTLTALYFAIRDDARMYDNSADCGKAAKDCLAVINDLGLSYEQQDTLNEAEAAETEAHELQGFINGFRLGAGLMLELKETILK